MLSYLSEVRLSEGLLDDDVDQIEDHVVVFHLGLGQTLARKEGLGFSVDEDFVLLTTELGDDEERLGEVGGSVD